MMLERGTVPPNYGNSGEAMPRGEIRDRKHEHLEIVSGKSQNSLKSPFKGEGFVRVLLSIPQTKPQPKQKNS